MDKTLIKQRAEGIQRKTARRWKNGQKMHQNVEKEHQKSKADNEEIKMRSINYLFIYVAVLLARLFHARIFCIGEEKSVRNNAGRSWRLFWVNE